jgi:hypothetical protein
MERKSSKTASVMKLITGKGTAVNPVLDEEFKREVIVSREKKRNNNEKNDIVINITAELVSKWMPEALKRFGCCCCDICLAEATVEALERVPSVEVKIRTEKDMKKAEAMKNEYLKTVMMTLVQIAVERKTLKKHE